MKTPDFLVLGPYGSGISAVMEMMGQFGYVQIYPLPLDRLAHTINTLQDEPYPLAISLQWEELATETDTAQDQLTHSFLTRLQSEWDCIQRAYQSNTTAQRPLSVLLLMAEPEVLLQRVLAQEITPIDALQQGLMMQDQIACFTHLQKNKRAFEPHFYAIDTTQLPPVELRNKIAKLLGAPMSLDNLEVRLVSFGFKYGIPKEADMVFDMRFLTNPFYDQSLRPLSGLDSPVRDFVFSLPSAKGFFEHWTAMLATVLPSYLQEGKSVVTLAVGCTGGQHRSVCMAEAAGQFLKAQFPGYNIVVNHREQAHWQEQAQAQGQGRNSDPIKSA
ncbi:MAG: hypothetical protein K2X01_00080 [Cyanobacteria bacterium]|nr:hypothetical protein [Cyanobacteriota bacterium]